MRTIPVTVQTGIDEGKICSLLKITTKNGSVYGFTDHDKDLVVDGVTYVAAPALQNLRINSTTNAKVGNQQLAQAWVTIEDEALKSGQFDEVTIDTYRCAWRTVEDTDDVLPIQSGILGSLQWTEDGFKVDVQDVMRNLRKNIGFATTPNCRHELFSSNDDTLMGACTLSTASYVETCTVSSVTTNRIKFVVNNASPNNGSSEANGWFDNGVITWTSGDNNGLSYPIKKSTYSASTHTITLLLPTVFDIDTSDNVSILPGCDKKFSTCSSKFSNTVNFGGFPHITPEVNYK